MRRPLFAVFLVVTLGCHGSDAQSDASSNAEVGASAPSVSAPAASARGSAGAVGSVVGAPSSAPTVDVAAVFSKVGAACPVRPGITFLVSPAEPDPLRPLGVLVVANDHEPIDGLVAIEGTAGPEVLASELRAGPPPSAYASLGARPAGKVRVVAVRAGEVAGCIEVTIETRGKPIRFSSGRRPWQLTRAWDRVTEDLYSAWIEKLFDAKVDEQPSYAALHDLTRDPKKNLLFDHLALGEDAPSPDGLKLDPDCADLPYYLRAYFAFKLGLPLAFSSCTRGSRASAPKCLKRRSSLEPMEEPVRDRVRRFERFARVTLSDTVHSGTGRTLATDDFTDYYPIALTRETLRPGAIYADPYGHVLVVAKVFPQTDDGAGALFAFDGQPDGTVAKKRFWRGNFLFSQSDPSMGNPGFKRFRPVRASGDEATMMTNAEIAASTDYGDFSLEQSTSEPTRFYDAMDDVLSPRPLSAERAMVELVQALDEQVHARIKSVDNGEKHFRQGGARIDIPENDAAIFETTGDWEDFSTPSRDLRLLVAIDVVRGFPALVGRRPARFVLPAGATPESVEKALAQKLEEETEKRKVRYLRSDGSELEITLAELMRRSERLEIAYDPNDCAEYRWGAAEGSDEMKTCKRRTSGANRARLEKLRKWFQSRTRPPRGG